MVNMTPAEKREADQRKEKRKIATSSTYGHTEEQLSQMIDIAFASGYNDQVIEFTRQRDELRAKKK